MNFSPDSLEAPARREEPQTGRVHYTNEFHIYQKARTNGSGLTKRARCHHCQGDWAYNETRLKHHVTDPFRGCRRIPPEARERVRLSDNSTSASQQQFTQSTQLPTHTAAPHPPLPPPAKRKREDGLPTSPPIQTQSVVPFKESVLPVSMPTPAEGQPPSHVRVTVEFCMASGALLRASWLAAEIISEFHRDIFEVTLSLTSTENTFNIYIGGKVAWSRGEGQPLPDYDYLRPIFRAQCSNATL